jgi:hypothetical protein
MIKTELRQFIKTDLKLSVTSALKNGGGHKELKDNGCRFIR